MWEFVLKNGKGILKIDYKPSEEIDHVQFHIDRCNKKISAEYNQKYVEDKVKTLRKRINDKKSKSLHPIFISSRLRKENIETISLYVQCDQMAILLCFQFWPNSFILLPK